MVNLTMQEAHRYKVISEVKEGYLKVREAAEILGLSQRHLLLSPEDEGFRPDSEDGFDEIELSAKFAFDEVPPRFLRGDFFWCAQPLVTEYQIWPRHSENGNWDISFGRSLPPGISL